MTDHQITLLDQFPLLNPFKQRVKRDKNTLDEMKDEHYIRRLKDPVNEEVKRLKLLISAKKMSPSYYITYRVFLLHALLKKY